MESKPNNMESKQNNCVTINVHVECNDCCKGKKEECFGPYPNPGDNDKKSCVVLNVFVDCDDEKK